MNEHSQKGCWKLLFGTMKRMIALKRLLIIIFTTVAIPIVLSSCSARPPKTITDYEIGQPKTVNTGEPMITVTRINSGRARFLRKRLVNTFKTRLIYGGKAGQVIKLMYREFADDLARQAFHQELQYDLAESDTISFQNLSIHVLEATNSSISFKVLSD